MFPSRAVFSFLGGVLLVQLLGVSVHFPVTQYTFGDILLLQSSATAAQMHSRPMPVQYTAKNDFFDSIVFTGDVLLARNIEQLMKQYGPDYPYQGLSFSALAGQPAVVGNFEASIPKTHVPTPALAMHFSVAAKYIPALAQAGFTHLSLANNHAFDYDKTGYNSAQKTLEQQEIETLGHPYKIDASAVEFITIEDTVVAVLAAQTLHQLPTYSDLKEVFAYANARSDLQIVYVHWGTEYVSTHNDRQKVAAKRFVQAGADLVVGHHPHVVQDVGLIDGVPVFYSLGNYIFDQYEEKSTQEGLLLQLDVSQAQPRVSLLPVTSVGNLSQPHFMPSKDHSLFLERLANSSAASIRNQLTQGYILLGEPVATSAKVAIMSQ